MARGHLENINRCGKPSMLRRPDISVLNAGRIKIEPNYSTARIYPGCLRDPDCSGRVERREHALRSQRQTMSDKGCVGVTADARALRIGTAV